MALHTERRDLDDGGYVEYIYSDVDNGVRFYEYNKNGKLIKTGIGIRRGVPNKRRNPEIPPWLQEE